MSTWEPSAFFTVEWKAIAFDGDVPMIGEAFEKLCDQLQTALADADRGHDATIGATLTTGELEICLYARCGSASAAVAIADWIILCACEDAGIDFEIFYWEETVVRSSVAKVLAQIEVSPISA